MIRRVLARVLPVAGTVRRRPAMLHVTAEPETALLASAAALRRLGARIIRYDPEAATLEARGAGTIVRVSAVAVDTGTSRLAIAADGTPAGRLARRLRAELARGVGR